jgi:hypothetical protein
MKKEWIITFRSVTFAQKGERVLRRRGLDCRLARTPKHLSERGCSYCLRLRNTDAMTAVEMLRGEAVEFEKVYAMLGGEMEERLL